MALMGVPKRKNQPVSGAVSRGEALMAARAARGVRGSSDPGAYGFNVDFVQTPNGPQRVPSGTQPANATEMRAAPSRRLRMQPQLDPSSNLYQYRYGTAQQKQDDALYNAAPQTDAKFTTTGNVAAGQENFSTTSGGLPPSEPVGGGTNPGTDPYLGPSTLGNTAPGSTATGANANIENNVPGSTGTVDQQREDDYSNFLMQLFLERDGQLGGDKGPGGNNIASDGTYNLPDFIRGLMGRYDTGANTDAANRAVTSDETVQGRLSGLLREDNELNRIAKQDAIEQAANAGLVGGSSGAAGAALRASRAAMTPIAAQDAGTYAATARDNMDATNRDRLSDQELRSGLIGQEANLAANLYESASDRQWRSKEANHERIWKSMESRLGWLRQSVDREDTQNFAAYTREDEQGWNAWQNDLQREFQRWAQNDEQDFQGSESERARLQERSMAYFNMAFGREGLMAQGLAAIYSNPNLTPAQQAAAAGNFRTLMMDVWSSFNETFEQGIPNIFRDPTSGTPTGGGSTGGGLPPSGSNPPPATTPPTTQPPANTGGGSVWEQPIRALPDGTNYGPGTPDMTDPSSLMAPIAFRDSAGIPTYAEWGGFDQDGYPIWNDNVNFRRLRFDAQGNVIPSGG
jgi:hypothetical protein